MKNFKRVLSLALAALMVIGGLVVAPVDTKAADATYTKVTTVDQINAGGNFVIIAELDGKYYAADKIESNWLVTKEITIENDKITSTDVPVVSIAANNGKLVLSDSTGAEITANANASKSKNNVGTTYELKEWSVSAKENGKFALKLLGVEEERYLSLAKSGDVWKFRQYTTSTISGGSYGAVYVSELLVYSASAGASSPSTPPTETATDLDVPANATPAEIVDLAYTLASGKKLTSEVTLEGVITDVKDFNEQYGNRNLTIQVGDKADKTIYCFATGNVEGTTTIDQVKALKVGDTVTIKGTISNCNGTIEFYKGSLVAVKEATVTPPTDNDNKDDKNDKNDKTEMTQKEIVDAAFALEAGKYLGGDKTNKYTLKGIVVSLEDVKEYNGTWERTFIIKVEGKEIKCFCAKGEKATLESLKEGSEVTLNGAIKNYNGTIEFEFAQLEAIEGTGDFSSASVMMILFIGVAIIGVSTFAKKRMA